MIKVYCDLCNKKLDTVYDTITLDKELQVCHKCKLKVIELIKESVKKKSKNRR